LISDRGEVQKGSAEIFFRKVKFWEDGDLQEAPPVFVGIIFLNQAEHIITCFKLEREYVTLLIFNKGIISFFFSPKPVFSVSYNVVVTFTGHQPP